MLAYVSYRVVEGGETNNNIGDSLHSEHIGEHENNKFGDMHNGSTNDSDDDRHNKVMAI